MRDRLKLTSLRFMLRHVPKYLLRTIACTQAHKQQWGVEGKCFLVVYSTVPDYACSLASSVSSELDDSLECMA